MRWRRDVRALVELFALCGFAITQPLLDLFGRGVEQFALRGASSGQIVVFAFAVAAMPTLLLWAIEALVGLVSARARRVVHAAFLGVLVAMVVLQAARPLTTGIGLLLLALAAGLLAILARARLSAVRIWLSFAALGPFAFVALFLLTSPTSDLLDADPRPATVDIEAPAPVVMLVLDELPLASLIDQQGDIDAAQYPGFARLAASSHWFRGATSVSPTTWHSVPTIVTGQLPEEGGAPTARSQPDSLFTLLGDQYRMEVTETVTRLCPSSLCSNDQPPTDVWGGLAGDALRVMRSRLSLARKADDPVEGFAELSEPVGDEDEDAPLFEDLGAPQPARFQSLLEGLETDEPALHFLHLLLPHVPYRHLPSGTRYEGPSPDLGRNRETDRWFGELWPVTLGHQRHLLQLRYVDRLITTLLDQLDERGLYDDALVVVTADHGISFVPGGPIRALEGQALDAQTSADLLPVPLFVKEPHQRDGTVSDANVLLVDVLPTIADVLGIDLPFAVDGQSALGPPRANSAKPFYGSDSTAYGPTVEDPVTFDAEALAAAVRERSVGAFLGGGGPDAIWRLGPSPSLVGTPVQDLPEGALERLEPVLLDPEAFDDVARRGTKPALVRGRLDAEEVGTPIAIVLNGVVVATAPTYPEDGGVAFAVVVDEAAMRPGANELRVYRIR